MLKGVLCFLNVSGGELFVIILVLIVVIGPKKLPEVAKKIGLLLAEAKKITSEAENEFEIDEKSFDVEPDNDIINDKFFDNEGNKTK